MNNFAIDVESTIDYYPFGQEMPGRVYSASSYRMGYNGQWKDGEFTGTDGCHYEFKFREYDSRIGRFWQVDPLFKNYPWNSTYAFAENDVISCLDLEGKEKLYYSNDFNSNTGKVVIRLSQATTVFKEFKKVLKGQNQIDVYVYNLGQSYQYTHGSIYNNADNLPTAVTDNISKDELSNIFKGGRKLIFIASNSSNDSYEIWSFNRKNNLKNDFSDVINNIIKNARDLNDEFIHVKNKIKTNCKNSNASDHEENYGVKDKSYDTPSDEDVDSDPKYANTKAYKSGVEIKDEAIKVIEEIKYKILAPIK